MEPIFRGVVYLLDLGDNAQPAEYHALQHLLDEHGAKETDSFADTPATRIITTSGHYFKMLENPWWKICQGNGVIVTTEWVYRSISAGVQRPSQYYSADPGLFLSGFVLSTHDIESSCVSREREQVIEYGGEWLDALADHTTHLISNKSDSPPGPVVVSTHSLRTLLARKERLPHPSECVVDGQNVSAAHFYCHGLLSQSPVPIVASPTPPNRRLSLPYFPCEIVTEIFLVYQSDALATRPIPDMTMDFSSLESLIPGFKMPVQLSRPPRFDYMREILLLTHVCGRWRLIAHYAADLWIDIQYHFHSEDTRLRRLNLVALWMERSSLNSPRGLSFNIHSCYPGARNPVIDFILANAGRIRSLHLKLPEPHFPHLLQTPPGLFTTLESLTLVVIHKCDTMFKSSSGLSRDLYFLSNRGNGPDTASILWPSVNTPFTAFQHAPRLRDFAFDAWAVFNNQCMFDIVPWSNLTDVDLRFVMLGVHDVSDLLPRLTKARKFNVRMDGRQGMFMPALPRTIRLPLVSLEWDGGNYVEDASVFAPLVLPYLKSLDLWYNAGAEGLRALCARSACKLETLSLRDSHLSYPSFSKFLAEVPTLTSLTLYHSLPITDKFLESLVYDSSTGFILPNLEYLQLAWEQPVFSERLMMKMVESRWQKTPLREVRINPSYKVKNDVEHRTVMEAVIRLVERGLNFKYGF